MGEAVGELLGDLARLAHCVVGLVPQMLGEGGGALLLAVEPLLVFGDDRRQPGRGNCSAGAGVICGSGVAWVGVSA